MSIYVKLLKPFIIWLLGMLALAWAPSILPRETFSVFVVALVAIAWTGLSLIWASVIMDKEDFL
jgi:hypothetical protein